MSASARPLVVVYGILGLDTVGPSVDIDVLMTGFRGLSINNKALASGFLC